MSLINGDNHTCIIAEIGINHNGDMDLAKKTILAAKNAGVNGVKFQNYRTEDFLSDRTLTYTYRSQGNEITESQYDMFKRAELSLDQLRELASFCKKENILFGSTPTNMEGVEDLVRAGASFIKNGSDYLVHLPLIEAMAKTGLPVVLACGMSTLAEIDDAVRAFRAAGGRDLVLLHCTSSYPTPPEDVNLRKIPVLKEAFGCKTGLSDHSKGITAAIGATVLGAAMIEKHFTLDKNLPGPDHAFSADPEEMGALVKAVREVEKELGTSVIGPTKAEMKERGIGRISCVAARDLPKGYEIGMDDIAFRRPGNGLPPKLAVFLKGKILKKPIKSGDLLEL